MSFTIATTVDEAVAAMAEGATPIAGGTDLVVGARHGKAPLPGDLVAIDRIDELMAIGQTENGTSVGALVSHARLMARSWSVRTPPSPMHRRSSVRLRPVMWARSAAT